MPLFVFSKKQHNVFVFLFPCSSESVAVSDAVFKMVTDFAIRLAKNKKTNKQRDANVFSPTVIKLSVGQPLVSS